ncbi:hypothetical protein [Piscirickettsia salmonis]|uniref:hypothetical protein n=1 Tax=Piscirickettsia salmonis TaxID=1238 RepID=UPI001B2FEA3D|nr:hypothetical protein [Piscirickettsia salmonis]
MNMNSLLSVALQMTENVIIPNNHFLPSKNTNNRHFFSNQTTELYRLSKARTSETAKKRSPIFLSIFTTRSAV